MNLPSQKSRFAVAATVRRADQIVRKLILASGIGVLLAVSGLFVFLFAEVFPLFQKAKVDAPITYQSDLKNPLLIGASPDGEWTFVLSEDGRIQTFSTLPRSDTSAALTLTVPFGGISTARWYQGTQQLLIGTSNGTIAVGQFHFNPSRDTHPLLEIDWVCLNPETTSENGYLRLDMSADQNSQTIVGIPLPLGQSRIHLFRAEQTGSPLSEDSKQTFSRQTLLLPDDVIPNQVIAGAFGDQILLSTQKGAVLLFEKDQDWTLIQSFNPFSSAGIRVVDIHPIQGRQSLYIADSSGKHHIATLFRHIESGQRQLILTKTFQNTEKAVLAFSSSPSNKALLVATEQSVILRNATTKKTRWRQASDSRWQDILLNSQYNKMSLLDENGCITTFPIRDPHPEAGWSAFFRQIWYEGYDAPMYIWQSSGGADTYEAKYSLVPLLYGSFKGTLFALLFAIPIALSAAIYTSQFLNPKLRSFIKPVVELMASFPSVVLGFLAALWLGPLLENRIPSFFLLCIAIPAAALFCGFLWNCIPEHLKRRVPEGLEFFILLPIIVITGALAWSAGPHLEMVLFTVQDPLSGSTTASFSLWWEAIFSGQFLQRNALVIGIIMGFAITPIIYTIAEDSLASVPRSLVSGSLALGANRLQTTFSIIVPTASAGIVSAIIIGTGRAIGETMVLLMATGNTPLLNWDLFSGMRSLAANIAIELPEAPADGTLYRSLFLGAMVLFLLTFIFNTVAEVLREKLRRKYRIIE